MTFIMVSDYYCEYLEHHTKLVESFDIYRIDANYNGWKKVKNISVRIKQTSMTYLRQRTSNGVKNDY